MHIVVIDLSESFAAICRAPRCAWPALTALEAARHGIPTALMAAAFDTWFAGLQF